MTKEIVRNIRLGAVTISGILLLIVALYFVGSSQNMFGKTIKADVIFRSVRGLQIGANVRFGGVNIGTVKNIEIVNDTTIKVVLSISSDMKRVIRKNSLASIGTDGLMGDKLINIEPGSGDSQLISDGDLLPSIPSVNTEEMMRTLDITNKNIAVVSANLRDITNNINTGRGTLYTILMDTTMALKIHNVVDNIDVVSSNILSITNDLENVTGTVESGHGLLGTLIKDTVVFDDLGHAIKEVRSAGEQINSSASELKQILQKAEGGNGTIGTLISDTVSANHLKQTLINVETGTKKFSEDMEALKHNFLLRGYFKKEEKKNKK
jgi:phospholipid/cholesterol/gamma-HCH transport system substrate-binding protein